MNVSPFIFPLASKEKNAPDWSPGRSRLLFGHGMKYFLNNVQASQSLVESTIIKQVKLLPFDGKEA